MAVIVWIHNLIYRLAFGLVRWVLGSIGRWLLTIYALLHEEVRRYLGLALSGTLIVLFGKATLNYAPPPTKKWLVLFTLTMLAVWAGAVRRAARHTRHNSLLRVKNRQAIQGMAADIAQVRGRVSEGLAKRAKGTPLEGAWSSNRSAREEERAAAERAAEKAEAERAAAEEQARRDRISEAERERELEKLGAEHNPFE